MIRTTAMLICLGALAACDNPFACNEKTETVIVDTASPFYSIDIQFLHRYEELGFDCDPTSISGTKTLYTCKKCD
jgi:hypothetical protein